jgi:hypothetical protein
MKSAKHAAAKARALAGGNPWLLAVALIGFSVSFQTISRLATLHHLPGYPVLYPVLIDVGILAMVTESRRAVAAKRSDLAPRLAAWVLIALTLYVNVHGSPANDWLGRALHIVGPALWAALLELSRWRELARAREDRGDPIPLARWFLAFRRTARLKRHMVLWGETSYSRAVSRQAVLLYATAVAQADKRIGSGPLWRRRLPVTLRWQLAEGKPPADVERAIAATYGGVETWQEPVAEWVDKSLRLLPRSVTAKPEAAVIQGVTQVAAQGASRGVPQVTRQGGAKSLGQAEVRSRTDAELKPEIRRSARSFRKSNPGSDRGIVTYVADELSIGRDRARRLLAELDASGLPSIGDRREARNAAVR